MRFRSQILRDEINWNMKEYQIILDWLQENALFPALEEKKRFRTVFIFFQRFYFAPT